MIAPLTPEEDAAFIESYRPHAEPSAYEPGLRICLPFRDVLVPWNIIRHRDDFTLDEPFIGWIKMPFMDYRRGRGGTSGKEQKGPRGRIRHRQSRPVQTISADFRFNELQQIYAALCEIRPRPLKLGLPLEIVDHVMGYVANACHTGIPANCVLLEAPRLLTHWAGHNAQFVEEAEAKESDLLVRFWHFNVRSDGQSMEQRSRGPDGIVRRLAFQSLPLTKELVRGGLAAIQIDVELRGSYHRRLQTLERSPEPPNRSFIEIHVCDTGNFVDGGNFVNETFHTQEPDKEGQLADLTFAQLGRLAKRHNTNGGGNTTGPTSQSRYGLHHRQWMWERCLRDYYKNGPRPHECRPKTKPLIVSDVGCDRLVKMTISRADYPAFWQSLTPGCALAVYVCTKASEGVEFPNYEDVIGCLALGTLRLYADLSYMAQRVAPNYPPPQEKHYNTVT